MWSTTETEDNEQTHKAGGIDRVRKSSLSGRWVQVGLGVTECPLGDGQKNLKWPGLLPSAVPHSLTGERCCHSHAQMKKTRPKTGQLAQDHTVMQKDPTVYIHIWCAYLTDKMKKSNGLYK